jgi:hypothetical protein
MPVNMNTFWSDLGVVSGNCNAKNQYDLYNGLTFDDGFVSSSQYDFFTHLNTNRYEFFKSYNSVDSNIIDEYTFYQNTSDPNIYDFKTFYENAAQYICATPVTPTPTPSITPTNTVTPTITPTSTITPTPTLTPTPSPQPASVTYTTNVNDNADLTTYTFASANYGGAGFIVVGISSLGDAPQTVGSVSIAGVSATQLTFIQGATGVNANAISSLWGAQITGGTSGNIVVTFSGGRRNCNVGVFRVQNLISTTPTHSFTNTSATDDVSGTLTGLTTSGIIISHATNDDGGICTWTNNTERYDTDSGGGTATAASRTSPSGSLTITSTFDGGPNESIVISSISLR